jgi:peptide/nickel transport system ATP-binding protein
MSAQAAVEARPVVCRAEGATKLFPAGRGEPVRAVDGVDLAVHAGEVVAIVGESGSGKSTLGRMLIRLTRPSSGRIWFDGADITTTSEKGLRPLRPRMQLVFQDPYGSLNPRMSVGASVGYVLAVNRIGTRSTRQARVAELLDRVGLSAAHAKRLPHQLSGGQRQRVAIARAVAANPVLVVADEPVSALDLSTQAQVLNLFRELQADLGLAMVFITHDLAVAEYVADRVVVMYAGRAVEEAPTASVFRESLHPYTTALAAAAVLEETVVIDGEPPNPRRLPSGCAFHPRCARAVDLCRQERPELEVVPGRAGSFVACHRAYDGA